MPNGRTLSIYTENYPLNNGKNILFFSIFGAKLLNMFSLIEYNEADCKTLEGSFSELESLLKTDGLSHIQRIDIDIKECTSEVEQLAKFYQLHPLTVDDILKPGHLPKFEAFDDYFFLGLVGMVIYMKSRKWF